MKDEGKTRDELIEEMRQLRRESETYRLVIKSGSDPFFLLDSSMNVLSCNPASLQKFGFKNDGDVQGRSVSMLYPSKESYSAFLQRFKHSDPGAPFRTRWEFINQDRRVFPAEIRIFRVKSGAVTSSAAQSDYFALLRDVSAEKEAQRSAFLTSMRDQLTGLPNRILLNDRIYRAILQGERSGQAFVILSIGLDRFKSINESLGYTAGDDLLKAIARRIKAIVHQSDTVARMAGVEFVLLLPDVGSREKAVMIAGKILAAFGEAFSIDGREVRPILRIGIALFPQDGGTGESLLRRANLAMHSAPEAGYQCYSPDLEA